MFEEALQAICRYDRIILFRHSNPDGDAMGSQTGLKEILRTAYPEKTVYTVGDEAGRYAFMAGSTMDEVPDEAFDGALGIILDTGAPHLISDPRWQLTAETLRVDHHIFAGAIAAHEWIDPSYESCCGMVADFALSNGLTVNTAAATALFTGMVTDSGRFRYDCTSARTLRLAAALLERGVDADSLYRELYASDFEQIRLRAAFTARIQVYCPGVAYLYNTAEDVEQSGQSLFGISRGMVGLMGDIRGIDIWVNFTESPDGVLMELRSSCYAVQPIAAAHGGGGHAKACGATLKDRGEAMQVLEELKAFYEAQKTE